jgi:threonine aldolase
MVELIARAHRFRKMLGGGMRQVGILAAAGLYAIEHNIDRLKEDHQRAKRLGDAVASLGSLKLKWPVDTNFVMIDLSDSGMPAVEAVSRLKAEGVGIMHLDSTSLRAVTHLDVDDEGIDYALDAFRRVFG